MWPILLALVPAFGWGFQGIVMQKVGGTTANKQMGMVLTTLLFGIVVLSTSLSVGDLQEFHGLIDEFGKAYRDDAAKSESFLGVSLTQNGAQ